MEREREMEREMRTRPVRRTALPGVLGPQSARAPTATARCGVAGSAGAGAVTTAAAAAAMKALKSQLHRQFIG